MYLVQWNDIGTYFVAPFKPLKKRHTRSMSSFFSHSLYIYISVCVQYIATYIYVHIHIAYVRVHHEIQKHPKANIHMLGIHNCCRAFSCGQLNGLNLAEATVQATVRAPICRAL